MPNSEIFRTYCSVCQLVAEMEVIGIDEEIDIIWVRCPGCNVIFPSNLKGTTSSHWDVSKLEEIIDVPQEKERGH